jgi:hypothetical protein
MDKREDKKLETFIDKFMGDAPLESPSVDFTQKVLHKLEADAQQEVFQYKPLVSGKILSGVSIAFVALLVFIGAQLGMDSGQGWFASIHMDAWFQTDWQWVDQYTSSKIMVYAFLLFGFMFFVQVGWLKKQMDQTLG